MARNGSHIQYNLEFGISVKKPGVEFLELKYIEMSCPTFLSYVAMTLRPNTTMEVQSIKAISTLTEKLLVK